MTHYFFRQNLEVEQYVCVKLILKSELHFGYVKKINDEMK